MAEDTKTPTQAKPAEKEVTEKIQAEPTPPRVTRKIDMNTVAVKFDKKDKGKKFQVLDSGVLKGEGQYDGESEDVTVTLSNYLKKGTLHDFSVIFV